MSAVTPTPTAPMPPGASGAPATGAGGAAGGIPLGTPEPSTPGQGASGRRAVEHPEARRARLARRRRLITWSIPVVAVVLVIAVKLLVMTAASQRALEGFHANNADAVHQAADTMSVVNVIEAHKAPFARGDAWVLAGDLERARASFEEALALAPADSVDSCQVRVNLALALEKLGDAAKAAGDEATARAHWQRVVEVTAAAPPGCFQPPADGAGDKAKAAGERAKAKLDPNAAPPTTPPQTPEEQQEQQQKQDDLDRKTEENRRKRIEQGPDGQGTRPPGGGNLPPGAKPW